MKRFLLIILGMVVIGSIIGNIRTQYGTLNEALKQNSRIEQEISDLKQENQKLKQKIEYATSSAFIEQEARDKLGLGDKNDVWIKLGEEIDIDLFPKTKDVEEVSKIRQWIKLFTQ